RQEGDEPKPLAVSRREPAADDRESAAALVETICIDMEARRRRRREGSVISMRPVADDLVPPLCRDFAAEHLGSLGLGEAATFAEPFLRRWFRERLGRQLRRRGGPELKARPWI